MKNNIILSSHIGLSGSFINFYDYVDFLQNNYLKNIKINYYFFYNKLPFLFTKSYRQYNIKNINFYNINTIKKFSTLSFNFVFTDIVTLFNLINNKILLKCNNIILLDNLEIALYIYNINNNDFYKFYKNIIKINYKQKLFSYIKFNKIYFLVTPFLYNDVSNFFKDYKNIEFIPYLKKINLDVLNTINIKPTKECFSREYINKDIKYISNFKKININPFEYKCYYYKRRKFLSYIEMFGRMIFEFILLNRKVKFAENIADKHDGLLDYIEYYRLSKNKMINKINIKNDNLLKELVEFCIK